MARPERKNADYFPFYAKDGRTLFILEGKYRCKGTGFFTNVMRFLTLQDDHYFCIAGETDQMYFMSKCHCDESDGMDMLKIMVKTEKLNKELWDQCKIIACQDLLDSLKDAYRKRSNKIITMDEIRVNAGVKGVSGGRNEVKGGDNPQRKVKETKVKETKVKKLIPPSEKEVIKYFQKKGYLASAGKKAFDYYHNAEPPWTDTNGKKVRSWKSKMIGVWFKDENKDTLRSSATTTRKICQAGPCQTQTDKKYCKQCQVIINEAGCKTYEEYMEKGDGAKNVEKLANGLFKSF